MCHLVESRILAAVLAASLWPGLAPAQEGDPAGAVISITDPRDGYPDISPDGSRVVFQSNRSGTWQIWMSDADGTNLTRVTHGGHNDVTPVWSPDGSRILFASDRAGGAARDFDPAETFDARDVYVMDLDQGLERAEVRLTRLTDDAADEMHPEWAAGGERILFNRVHADGAGSDLVLMHADGSHARRVGDFDGWNTYAAMTPDGRRIVWRRIVEEGDGDELLQNSEIFSADPEGDNAARLTDHPAFDGWPAISPDGKHIAFASNRSGDGRFHVYLMDMDGGGLRQVTEGGAFHYTQPAWSPDGRKLAAFRWMEDAAGEIGHVVMLDLE